MVFNRKKAEGMAEGMLLAVNSTTANTAADGQPPQEDPAARLMLLLRILHQVFSEGKDDADTFQKSAQLRSILADVALTPLLQALATTTAAVSEQRGNYHAQVKEMIDQWKEFSVFDGPTVWEGYKKAWGRAVQDSASASSKKEEGEGNDSFMADASPVVQSTTTTNDAPIDVEMKGEQSSTMEGGAQESQSASLTKDETMNNSNTDGSLQLNDASKEEDATKKEAAPITEPIPSTTIKAAPADDITKEEAQEEPSPSKQAPKRDSMTSVTSSIEIDFDAEGVEEAEVEPTKFLEASKVIASLQIARGTF